VRGDEQEPDMRRDASGASGHVTAKPSICGWGAFCKSGVYAAKVTSLTPGDLSGKNRALPLLVHLFLALLGARLFVNSNEYEEILP